MDGALLGNLDQLSALCVVQWPDQFNAAQNAINHRLWILTVGTVIGVDSVVSKPHNDLVESPIFPSRVHVDRHRGATAERHQQQLVGTGTGVASANRDGILSTQRVEPV